MPNKKMSDVERKGARGKRRVYVCVCAGKRGQE